MWKFLLYKGGFPGLPESEQGFKSGRRDWRSTMVEGTRTKSYAYIHHGFIHLIFIQLCISKRVTIFCALLSRTKGIYSSWAFLSTTQWLCCGLCIVLSFPWLIKSRTRHWQYASVVEFLPSVSEGLDSISSTKNKNIMLFSFPLLDSTPVYFKDSPVSS